ncbi:type II toxin-antitoxin system VapC family toxin [Segnochrobactrum spirostomi]|uniref:Ribonuclease VapC n=1 Tax=Segnochrobactrum spirostomi TaxID=2608987 RepID=A0A6A7Y8P3_9HYPH|nr:type II toxin-antitoxin system VapC family toxin [Segnochrobactrum spirostomi]MQT14348.1 type II toxin-antitoxin system VapC family toxin [Segnochrobactrum spirostomi]
MLYLDTSLIVAGVVRETVTPLAQVWLQERSVEELLISEWTFTEMSSALAIKLRTGQINLDQRAAAMALFQSLVAENFKVLHVRSRHFRQAAQFADQHGLGLRAGDALHLAVAAENGATVHTLDHRLASAGPALGVPTQLMVWS